MLVTWKWLGLWSSLLAIFWMAAIRHDASGDQKTVSATPAGFVQSPLAVLRDKLVPSFPASIGALSRNDPVAATSVNSLYSLDLYQAIPAPWYGDNPPEGDAPAFTSTVIGDVTGDGRNDLLAIGAGVSPGVPNELLVYVQRGDGTLVPAVRYPTGQVGLEGVSLVMGDFNEDGISDVVLSGYKHFALFESKAAGEFKTSTYPIFDPVELGSEVPAAPMDVNQDGHLDLVFYLSRTHAGSSGFPTAETHTRVVVWYGDGLGGFAGSTSFKTYGSDAYDIEIPISMVSGDLNADGRPDLAVRVRQIDYLAQIQRQLIRVYLQAGGQLVPAYDLDATRETGANYSSMDYLAIGDFNNDGRNDMAGSHGGNDQRVWILYQSAGHRFDTPADVRSSQPIGVPMRVADLDNNGLDDLLIGHDGWGRVTYHLQSVVGLAEPEVRYFVNNAAPRLGLTSLAVGDLNGDGCADVSVAASYNGLRILRGTNCATRLPPVAVCHTEVQGSPLFSSGLTATNVLGNAGQIQAGQKGHVRSLGVLGARPH